MCLLSRDSVSLAELGPFCCRRWREAWLWSVCPQTPGSEAGLPVSPGVPSGGKGWATSASLGDVSAACDPGEVC